MNKRRIKRAGIGIALLIAGQAALADGFDYPDSRRIDHTDTYHGTEVADPYRWLEEDVRESEAVAGWVEAQNEVTFAYLHRLPGREAIRARLEQLWNYEKYLTPWKEGGRYFFRKNDGLQNQYVLYTMDTLDGEPRVLIDPNGWSDDGTMALSGMQASPDGRHFAYGVQDGGSDWRTWRVMEIESGRVLDDEIHWLKFNQPAWTADGKGFFYSRFPEPAKGAKYQDLNTNSKLFYHRLGTAQEQDELIFETPEHPDWVLTSQVTDDGTYLVVTVFKGTDNRYRVYFLDLTLADRRIVPLVEISTTSSPSRATRGAPSTS